MKKSLRIKDVIKLLNETLDEYGNIPVVLASDSELNSVGTFNPDLEAGDNISIEKGIAVLFPFVEGLDVEDIKGATVSDNSVYDDEGEYDDELDELTEFYPDEDDE